MTGCGRRRRTIGGFTLVELLVALTIFGVVLAAVSRLMLTTQQAYVRQREAGSVLGPLRRSEATLARLLRGAGANPAAIIVPPTGRLVPGIYSVASPAGGMRFVADHNPPDGNLDAEFEDVQSWVANDTLWVSWRNQAGTAAAAQPVAAPVTSVTYSFVDSVGATVTPSPTTRIAAARVQLTITAPQRVGATTTQVRRQVWVTLRNW